MSDGLALVLWMAGALISFSATAIAVREFSGAISLFDALAARSGTGIAFALAIAASRGALRALAPRRVGLHLLRNVVHFLSIFAWSLGLTLLPLGTVFALEFTAPAWVTLFAALVLHERLTVPRLGAVVLGIVGVAVILRPGAAILDPAALIVLGAAVGFAIVTIATKMLTRTEPTIAILFWLSAIQLPLNLIAGALVPLAPATRPFGLHEAAALGALCIGGFTSHWCLTNAYHRGDAVVVMPLDCLRIPLIAVLGWQIYGERLDPYVFLGAAFIVGGIFWSLFAEARRKT
jgi:drug/metabolite transporter (DMT)-like permease